MILAWISHIHEPFQIVWIILTFELLKIAIRVLALNFQMIKLYIVPSLSFSLESVF